MTTPFGHDPKNSLKIHTAFDNLGTKVFLSVTRACCSQDTQKTVEEALETNRLECKLTLIYNSVKQTAKSPDLE